MFFNLNQLFTNKRELQKIYRIKFDDFDKIDLLIKKLNDLESIEYERAYLQDHFCTKRFLPLGNNKWYHTL